MTYKNLQNHALKLRDFVLTLVFPTTCLNCEQEGSWLCAECSRQLEFLAGQLCFGCKTASGSEFCPACQPNYLLDGLLIAGDYDNRLLNELITKLKYHFLKDIAPVLGNYLVQFLSTLPNQQLILKLKAGDSQLKENCSANNLIIIPVPLSSRRQRWRGFNQATEIAAIVALQLDLPLEKNNLVRIKHRRAQAKLNEEQRKINVNNCFRWQGNNLAGKNILLVDDVATTGATLNECAKILKQNGAGKVWGLVAAKG
ncbi:MAG: phosphoribosyltransferase family protein [Candidatus Falkowbacteria bacterium]|nr:phosphoribosyltransferase family protein [Candidatus Falkowbacteria bacterium]